jgi:transposase
MPTPAGENSTLESVLALLVSQPEMADEVAKLRSERDGLKLERDEYKASSDEYKASSDEYKASSDEYKKQYLLMLEAFRKLELGLVGQKSERFRSGGAQEVFEAILGALKPLELPSEIQPGGARIAAHTRAKPKPTGKHPLPEDLPRVEVRVLPPEVEREGLDAFTQIGEDVKETIEKRTASFIVLRTVRPKFKRNVVGAEEKSVVQADAVPPPIAKALVGPTLLAESILLRWGMYLPLYRIERLYEQQGCPVARSTLCAWHFAAHEMMKASVLARRDPPLFVRSGPGAEQRQSECSEFRVVGRSPP